MIPIVYAGSCFRFYDVTGTRIDQTNHLVVLFSEDIINGILLSFSFELFLRSTILFPSYSKTREFYHCFSRNCLYFFIIKF